MYTLYIIYRISLIIIMNNIVYSIIYIYIYMYIMNNYYEYYYQHYTIAYVIFDHCQLSKSLVFWDHTEDLTESCFRRPLLPVFGCLYSLETFSTITQSHNLQKVQAGQLPLQRHRHSSNGLLTDLIRKCSSASARQ